MKPMPFVLLRTFRELFEGTQYKHRDSSLGDLVASQLYEDLVSLNKSPALARRVKTHERVVNLANRAVGRPSRRGDGTFGELVPTAIAITESGLLVARGEIANFHDRWQRRRRSTRVCRQQRGPVKQMSGSTSSDF